jgi:hypothetical protein
LKGLERGLWSELQVRRVADIKCIQDAPQQGMDTYLHAYSVTAGVNCFLRTKAQLMLAG